MRLGIIIIHGSSYFVRQLAERESDSYLVVHCSGRFQGGSKFLLTMWNGWYERIGIQMWVRQFYLLLIPIVLEKKLWDLCTELMMLPKFICCRDNEGYHVHTFKSRSTHAQVFTRTHACMQRSKLNTGFVPRQVRRRRKTSTCCFYADITPKDYSQRIKICVR